jgi:hypothetical protein
MIRRHELPSWIAYAIAVLILSPAAFVVHPLLMAGVLIVGVPWVLSRLTEKPRASTMLKGDHQ